MSETPIHDAVRAYVLEQVGAAYVKDECGWWGDVLYRSTIASNTWTPEAYQAGWEAV